MNDITFIVPVLNPGVDRIIYLDYPTKLGTMNRISKTVTHQGCKGANIAIMMKTLATDVEYISFAGGTFDSIYRAFTDEYGIKSQFENAGCGIRLNTKVIDSQGKCTELNERGGIYTDEEMSKLIGRVYACRGNAIVLSGSIPYGTDTGIYADMIKRMNDKGYLTVLDCDGEAMKKGLKAKPALIKPNRRELSGIIGVPEEELYDRERVLKGCRLIRQMYGCDVICTLDADGAIYHGGDGSFYVSAAKTVLRGFSGAGDTFLAAYLVKKYKEGNDTSTSLRYASAAAGAKVALEGTELPTKEQIDQYVNSVNVELLDDMLKSTTEN